MLAPHSVDIAVISNYHSLLHYIWHMPNHSTTFVFSLRQVKLCIGQWKYKQTFTTQGRSDRLSDRPSEWIRARSLNSYFAFCKIVVKTMEMPEKSFTTLKSTCKETKLKEFQFRLIHKIVVTKVELPRFGIKEDNECLYFGEKDSIDHTFLNCRIFS